MAVMRAKMQVARVEKHEGSNNETLHFHCVAKSTAYPADGRDDDNSFARWSPSGNMTIQVANPDLWGKFKPGDRFYLDFFPAPAT